ncbi:unnamed protein product [Vitrella brassicaformis CCMP3155]|uniref:Aspartate-semialdehyde dehydrogenase n=1 Tax=Vitrella brassicaformis (strain CCMP3155) TaxID=1169540 RepID=A0A0G4G959_VITBC|nr:unnamed protein product [Vitrella brassicaformis CCMP3155]|eukprot:CEM25113.1 unnamed protein product [Vitrella brassicaformis CCMP3155]
MEKKYRVGVLGATGAVGQRFLELLKNHPWFIVTALGASERSAGKKYGDVVNWKVSAAVPEEAASLLVMECRADLFIGLVDIVFSGLDSSVAGSVEADFASRGIPVFSNAKNHRMDADVPILIPVINADHLSIVRSQPTFKDKGGFIVTNANCASTGLSIALKPIHERFGIHEVFMATCQAISGAGYPGLPSMDILDNCIPFISGEEPKLEEEPAKILGKPSSDGSCIDFAPIAATAMCHRVAVSDGHIVSVSLRLRERPESDDEMVRQVRECLANYKPTQIVQQLPSCPPHCVVVMAQDDRPQPRLDRMAGEGMSTCVGRVRPCPLMDVKMTTLSHNTIIGAAGGSLLNAELAVMEGLIRHNA